MYINPHKNHCQRIRLENPQLFMENLRKGLRILSSKTIKKSNLKLELQEFSIFIPTNTVKVFLFMILKLAMSFLTGLVLKDFGVL